MLGSDQTVEDWEEGLGGEEKQDIKTSGLHLCFSNVYLKSRPFLTNVFLIGLLT